MPVAETPRSPLIPEVRAQALYEQHRDAVYRKIDHWFAWLLIFQWVVGIGVALWISPLTWAGALGQTHPHVWAAGVLGGLIISFPLLLILTRPGEPLTRHAVAVGQMLASALLIHLSGGRIETHFHVFGSLAFLAFYRDWRVLVTATVVVALDHFLRGLLWPQSVYGTAIGAEWRWLEHAGWVAFLDLFLIQSCLRGVAEMRAIALRQAELEASHEGVEQQVRERTAELESSEARTRAIQDSALDAIVTIDHHGTILAFNPAAEHLLGFSRERALGADIAEMMIPAPLREAQRAGLRHYLATGDAPVLGRRIEAVAVCANGNEVPIELAVVPILRDGPPIFTAFLRDLSDRNRVEEELRQAKEAAEAASRAKSEFLANMSHEVRTPMNGILGMTELALQTELTAEQREYLEMVRSSADALLGVINDILDFSKIEAGKLDLDPAEFPLRDTVGDTLKLLALRAHAKGLELAGQVDTDVPELVVGDAGRLRQVLLNLVGNAIKFTEKGEVVVTVRSQEHQPQARARNSSSDSRLLSPDSCVLHFSVSDTGIGISTDKLALIFEPFAQADGSTTRRFGGTGLGLTISQRLVALMGGRLWVESEPGKGSTFHFTARLSRAAGSVSRVLPPRPFHLADLPVLVVDDNATNRRILEATLRNWRMRPTCAEGGEPALVELRRAAEAGEPYPLVLLDAMMPGMDGLDLAGRIQESADLAGATVLMLTSADNKDDVRRCRELGLAAYLVKPIKQSELLNTILNALAPRLFTKGSRQMPVVNRTRPSTPSVSSSRGLRILLAEDNAVNQRLAVRMLEKAGHSVVLANNGREALTALEEAGPFNAVLMDVQMPEMGGLEATAVIRAWEAAGKTWSPTGQRLPIIALTAHAMQGDRERCLGAGMDAYLPKPIKAQELAETLRQVLLPACEVEPGLDPAVVRARFDGDTALLHEITDLFRQDSLQLIEELRQAITASDMERFARAAHTMKGSVSNFGPSPAFDAAFRLEMQGRAGYLNGAADTLAQLEHALGRLLHALDEILAATPV